MNSENKELKIPQIPGIKNIIGSLSFHYFRMTVVFEETVEEVVFVVPGEFVEHIYRKDGLIDEDKIGRILKNKFIDDYQTNEFERVAYSNEIDYSELKEELGDDDSDVKLVILHALDFPEDLTILLNDNKDAEPEKFTDINLVRQAQNAVMNDSPEEFKEIIEKISPQSFFRMLEFIPYSDDDLVYAKAIFESKNPIAFDYLTFDPFPDFEQDEDTPPDAFERLQDIERENIKRFILRVLRYAMHFTEYDIAMKIIERISQDKKNLPYLEYFLNEMYNTIGTEVELENYLPEEIKILELLKDKIQKIQNSS
jgi:hypothetical protein